MHAYYYRQVIVGIVPHFGLNAIRKVAIHIPPKNNRQWAIGNWQRSIGIGNWNEVFDAYRVSKLHPLNSLLSSLPSTVNPLVVTEPRSSVAMNAQE